MLGKAFKIMISSIGAVLISQSAYASGEDGCIQRGVTYVTYEVPQFPRTESYRSSECYRQTVEYRYVTEYRETVRYDERVRPMQNIRYAYIDP